jgi:hypothetical protein
MENEIKTGMEEVKATGLETNSEEIEVVADCQKAQMNRQQ